MKHNKVSTNVQFSACSKFTKTQKGLTKTILACAVMASFGTAHANTPNPISTATDAVATGQGALATATAGVAVGKDSVATGGKISRDQHKQALQAVKTLTDNYAQKQQALDASKLSEETATTSINTLTAQIQDLTNRIESNDAKQGDFERLSAQKQSIEQERDVKQTAYNNAKQRYDRLDKNVLEEVLFLDFRKAVENLDWRVLTKENGRDALATELKNTVERNFSDLAGTYSQAQYRSLIDDYINRQGSATLTLQEISKPFSKGGLNQESVDAYILGVAQNPTDLNAFSNKINYQDIPYLYSDNPDAHKLATLLILAQDVEGSKIAELKEVWGDRIFADMKSVYKSGSNLFSNSVRINGLLKDSELNRLGRIGGLGFKEFKNNPHKLPPFKADAKNQSTNNFLYLDYYERSPDLLKNSITSIFEDRNLVESSKFVNNYLSEFDDFYGKIDFSRQDWFFDLNDYKAKIDVVKAYNEQIRTYLNAQKTLNEELKKPLASQDRQKIEKANQDLISSRKAVKDGLDNQANYLGNIVHKANAETFRKEFELVKDKFADLTARANTYVRAYDKDNQIANAVQAKAAQLKKDLDDATLALNNAQASVDTLNQQISALNIDPQAAGLRDLRQQKQQALQAAQANLATLKQDVATKQEQLQAALTALQTSELANRGENAVAQGHGAFASGENSVALGANSTATGDNSVALGAGSQADKDNVVSVGSQGKERKIIYVADGEISETSKEAVNGSQIHALAKGISDVGTQISDIKKEQTAVRELYQGLNDKIDVQDKKLSGGVASAIAYASMPQTHQAGERMWTAGSGYFNGQSAVSLGWSGTSSSGKTTIKLGTSWSNNSNFSVGAGVGYRY